MPVGMVMLHWGAFRAQLYTQGAGEDPRETLYQQGNAVGEGDDDLPTQEGPRGALLLGARQGPPRAARAQPEVGGHTAGRERRRQGRHGQRWPQAEYKG